MSLFYGVYEIWGSRDDEDFDDDLLDSNAVWTGR
jgi:hypothetical protein